MISLTMMWGIRHFFESFSATSRSFFKQTSAFGLLSSHLWDRIFKGSRELHGTWTSPALEMA
jgi:hypothetical protein